MTFGVGDEVHNCNADVNDKPTPQVAFRVTNMSLEMRRGPRIAQTGDATSYAAWPPSQETFRISAASATFTYSLNLAMWLALVGTTDALRCFSIFGQSESLFWRNLGEVADVKIKVKSEECLLG